MFSIWYVVRLDRRGSCCASIGLSIYLLASDTSFDVRVVVPRQDQGEFAFHSCSFPPLLLILMVSIGHHDGITITPLVRHLIVYLSTVSSSPPDQFLGTSLLERHGLTKSTSTTAEPPFRKLQTLKLSPR